MSDLAPLETLFEVDRGAELSLPAELARLYDRLQFPTDATPPLVVGNFVETLDGIVSLNSPGHPGGGEVSGFNQHDRMVMGLLRSVADAVIVGAGTLRAMPQHLWTADNIYPPLTGAYQDLRTALGKPDLPLNVIVTARGEIDLSLPVFRSGRVAVLIATTEDGARRIAATSPPAWVRVASIAGARSLDARDILNAVCAARPCDRILIEGGPHLMADFFAGGCVDELFLTVAPQLAGRGGSADRPGLIEGRVFAPTHPLWGTLIGVRRAGSHLFLRYAFPRGGSSDSRG